MATAINSPARAGSEIKLEYGQPEVFALKWVTGKNVQGNYGPRVLFTAADDRRLWLDAEDGSDLERGMQELRVRAGDSIRVTKIRHPHGGGHSIRVELADESRLEADLRRSITRAGEAKGAATLPHVTAPASVRTQPNDNASYTQAGPLSPAGLRFMGAYKDAVDALIETQGYAKSRGLLIEIRCEDVRCLAATMMIQASKDAGGR